MALSNRLRDCRTYRTTRRKSFAHSGKKQNAQAHLAWASVVNWWVVGGFANQKSSPGRTRTYDKAVNSRLLYQLSYRGISAGEDGKVRAASCYYIIVTWCRRLGAKRRRKFFRPIVTVLPTGTEVWSGLRGGGYR